jgi:hypothetical protein
MRPNPLDGSGYCGSGIVLPRDVELDDVQIIGGAQRSGDGLGVATGGYDGMPGHERGFHDIYAHATTGPGHEPNIVVSHGSRVDMDGDGTLVHA